MFKVGDTVVYLGNYYHERKNKIGVVSYVGERRQYPYEVDFEDRNSLLMERNEIAKVEVLN